MKNGFIRTVGEFISVIPEFPKNKISLSESSRRILKLAYKRAENLPTTTTDESLKPPLIISFHPKVSLLNNNVHETFLAEKIAAKLGMIPLWIPYVYDTGYKTAADKIRLPTYCYFEGKFIPLRASAKIHGNITATEAPITQKEVRSFFGELEKHEISMLTHLKGMLNPFNFGHLLFNLKRRISGFQRKNIRERIGEVKKLWLEAIGGTKKLSESLAQISVSNLKEFGINVGLLMMDDILQEIVTEVFSEVLKTPCVKKDPSLLENLFLSYDLKTKERSPIMYTGDGHFIGFDEYDIRVFDGTLEELVVCLGKHTVLPTGHLIMTLFTAMGCKLVIGGAHTEEYYPDYFEKAYSLLKETSFNSKMTLLSYGRIRFMDIRNMYDVMSAVRVLDKVGSRNYIINGLFTLPDNIVDHLNFLTGSSGVAEEYNKILTKKIKGKKATVRDSKTEARKFTALEKEMERHKELEKILAKKPENILKKPAILARWIKGTKFSELHPVRLEVMLENLKFDADMRLKKLQENIDFEQHILGGTLVKVGIDSDSENSSGTESIVYDGIIKRSNRYPSLFEMVYYGCKPMKKFELKGHLKNHENKWIWKQFVHDFPEDIDVQSETFTDYVSVFNRLIPNEILVPYMKFQIKETKPELSE
ncbi:MAG: hypothetical protein ACTSWY_01330 [Promethearchaeota archaeon]